MLPSNYIDAWLNPRPSFSMAAREHFTNGRCLSLGSGLTLIGLAYTGQTSVWPHWITIGVGYVIGVSLTFSALMLIAKSYLVGALEPLSRDQREQLPKERPADSLRDRVFAITKEPYQFLRDLPAPTEIPKDARSKDEIFNAIWARDNGRVEKVNHGYMHRFRDRLVKLHHELADNGINLEAKYWEIDPPVIQREDALRRLEKALADVVVRMDLEEEATRPPAYD